MEANGFGTLYFDNYRLGVPSGGAHSGAYSPQNAGVPAAAGEGGFASLLKKTAADGELQQSTPVVSGKKVAIDKDDKLYQLCLELETFLVKNLLSSMRSTVQKSGLIDEGFAGKMYEDMLYDEYAKNMAQNANFGLAEQAYVQLKQGEATAL